MFNATPGLNIILLPDNPDYTIVAVSNDFIRQLGRKRDEFIGKKYVDLFPGTEAAKNGQLELYASLSYVCAHKEVHRLSLRQCTLPGTALADRTENWAICNTPLLDEDGKLLFIINTAVHSAQPEPGAAHSQQTIDSLFNDSPVGIIVYEALRDKEGRIVDFFSTYHNDRYCQLTGFTPEELNTSTFHNLIGLLGDTYLFGQFVAVAEKGESLAQEQFFSRTTRWLSVSATKFQDGFMVTLSDITDLKASQQILQQEIDFSKRILDTSLNGIYVLEAIRQASGEVVDFVCLQGNQKFTELTGYPIENVVGNSFVTLFPAIIESGFFNLLCQVITSGEPQRQATYYAKSFDRWYEYLVIHLGENRVGVTFQEISQQRESALQLERQKNLLDNILKHSPNGVSVYAPIRNEENDVIDFQCIISNYAAELFTQITTEERLSKTVLEITPDVKDTPLFQMAVTTIEKGQSFQSQYYHSTINKWLELSVVKMDDNHLINVFTDITSIKEVQLQLEQSVQELQRSNDELQQFAYVASHDLQEPLRKIRIFNNILSEKIEPESALRQYIDKVENSAVRMSGLIKSVLDYSRLSKASLRFEQVDLNVILQNVLADYELLIAQKNAVVQADELPVLEAVPLQINQLFFNLIGNALKFMRKGVPPVVTIQAKKLTAERKSTFTQLHDHKDYLELTIQDNGIGFNQEYASKIFTIFQRLNERSSFDGYGIGLALCKKVADTHNGVIYAEGKPKEGAAFTILLPYRQD